MHAAAAWLVRWWEGQKADEIEGKEKAEEGGMGEEKEITQEERWRKQVEAVGEAC